MKVNIAFAIGDYFNISELLCQFENRIILDILTFKIISNKIGENNKGG